MTDPYQQQPGQGPQYGAPGTGPDLGKSADPYAQQPQQPQQPYGQSQPQYPQPGYGQPGFAQPGYGQPGGYPPAQFGPGVDPEAPYGRDIYGTPLSDKQKLIAGLLQIFLGGFGIGRFYLGFNQIAVWQIVVTVLTCGIGSIWGLIDGILILIGKVPDPYGRPLRD
ncbi:TM2 domain [Nocardia otitidiscaviarum]|uniref:TM2 domain n=1 Tax=Nocardia otitidiscaviarum TaxID=1823 RepID=A0A379JIY9_9NOCA|nr:TM2 domain-containing protein [Nocardia otitidiscaviarum]SUD48221.1 TM2 domain [Nocardia otitidiscaviarum]